MSDNGGKGDVSNNNSSDLDERQKLSKIVHGENGENNDQHQHHVLAFIGAGHSLNVDAILKNLQLVLMQIEGWRNDLKNGATENAEETLTEIIQVLTEFSGLPTVEHVVQQLKLDLEIEVAKRVKLEGTVAMLLAKDSDQTILNGHIATMSVFKTLIMRFAINNGSYSAAFKKATDKDVIDALFPEDFDPILDSPDDFARKTTQASLHSESVALFTTLGIDSQVIYDLNARIQQRNLNERSLDNKRYKDEQYVKDNLVVFKERVDNMIAGNELELKKGILSDLIRDGSTLYSNTMVQVAAANNAAKNSTKTTV